MTVIATFSINGYPILFGDLLITGPKDNNEQSICVPAQGEVQDFFGASGWGIMGLCQKVTVINKRCVIAWAGSWLGAKCAISGLRELAHASDLTCESILQFLNCDPDLQRHPASFVGMTFESRGIRQFRFKAHEFPSPSLGTVFLSGSGSCAIFEFSDILKQMEIKSTTAPNRAQTAISLTLMLAGMLLNTELNGGAMVATLLNMFGGGYEVAYFNGDGFEKLDNVTYVFWHAEFVAGGTNLSVPLLLVKQKYIGDFLFIKSAQINSLSQDVAPSIKNEQAHVISPMFEGSLHIDLTELENISFQSELLCHCIMVKDVGLYTRVQRSSEEGMTFEDKDGQIVIGFHSKTMSEIAKGLEGLRYPSVD